MEEYTLKAEVNIKVKALDKKHAIELIENGFYEEWDLITLYTD